MEFTATFYIASIVAILITGISKSGFGGGLGVMAVPIMSLFVVPQFAAAVMMPILLAMDVLIVARYRKTWSRAVVLALLPGALVGLVVGGFSFGYMNADAVRFLIGSLALFFVLQFLMQRSQAATFRSTPRWLVWLLGAVSGFASYVAHAGGPPVKGYLLKQSLEKSTFVGTNTIYFFLLNALKTIAYGSTGTLSVESLIVSLYLAPVLLLGIFIGTYLHSRVDQSLFVKIVYGFLALTAIRLLSGSVPNLL